MRFPGVLRFDKADYERLSRESLWSATEALNVAANIQMEKSKGFQEDFWVKELSETFRRYRKLAHGWCEDKKLIPLSVEGRHGLPLPEEKWSGPYCLHDGNGETVGYELDLSPEGVYFLRDQFLACLKESGMDIGEDLWAEVKPKDGEVRLKSNQEAKLICQGMAIALWDANPEMTIAEMAEQIVILEAGGGQAYGVKTRRGWLSEVDPRPDSEKTGPKPK